MRMRREECPHFPIKIIVIVDSFALLNPSIITFNHNWGEEVVQKIWISGPIIFIGANYIDQKKQILETSTQKGEGTEQTKATCDRSQRAEASHVLWLPMNGKASQAVIRHNTLHAVMLLLKFNNVS